MADVSCPKDQTTMRGIERNGVTIERCPECGGIFLDRGELERLIEAEGRYSNADPKPARPRSGHDERGDDRRGGHDDNRRDDHRDSDQDSQHGSRYDDQPRRKRKGFLGDLLDFG